MVIGVGAQSQRRTEKRLHAVSAGHLCPRRPLVVFKTREDLEREAALTDEQRELVDAQVVRVARELS